MSIILVHQETDLHNLKLLDRSCIRLEQTCRPVHYLTFHQTNNQTYTTKKYVILHTDIHCTLQSFYLIS